MTMDIQTMLENEFAQKIAREFGVEGESDETKKYLLGQLMENIAGRVLLEALKNIPEEKRAELTVLAEEGGHDAIADFLEPYIPDFQGFVRAEAQKEIEQTRAYMLEE